MNSNNGASSSQGVQPDVEIEKLDLVGKKLELVSSDKVHFFVDEVEAAQSIVLKNMIDGGLHSGSVPILAVDAKTLSKLLCYCKKRAAFVRDEESLPNELFDAWEKEYLPTDLHDYFELMMAANYLEVESLVELCCRKLADLLRDCTVKQIRNLFGIKNCSTKEEEEEIKNQSPLARKN